MTSLAERPVPAAPNAQPSLEELVGAVDEALRASAALEGNARKVADAVRESIEAVHRSALVTIVRRLRADDAGRAALYELFYDPLVHMVFSLHGIIRPDPMTQARAVLDAVHADVITSGARERDG